MENRRVAGDGSVQKTRLYFGEINDSNRAAWTRAIEAAKEKAERNATRRHEGQYLLRSNLTGESPAELCRSYINLVLIEESFRTV